ncbi:MAG: EfeM/EfeO family lipoprotein [Dongiaceae bacterium]
MTHSCPKSLSLRAGLGAFAIGLLLLAADGQAQAMLDPTNYQKIVSADISRSATAVDDLVRRLEAGDLAGAKQAYVAARVGWERSESAVEESFPPQAALIDPWPNPTQGFHAVEAALFGQNDAAAALPAARKLQSNLAALRQTLQSASLAPQALLNGMAKVASELATAKSNGEESRLSNTAIYDLQHSYDGLRTLYAAVFAKPLAAADPARAQQLTAQIQRLGRVLHHDNVPAIDKAALKTEADALVRLLADAAPALGLQPPMTSTF